MLLHEVMNQTPVTVSPDDTLTTAAQRMRDANVGCLVVAEAGAVQGVITDRDITVRCVSAGHAAERCLVRHHMSSPAITVSPAMDSAMAVHLMTEKGVKRLPVVENGKLVGIISLVDIAQNMERTMHDLLIGIGTHRRAA